MFQLIGIELINYVVNGLTWLIRVQDDHKYAVSRIKNFFKNLCTSFWEIKQLKNQLTINSSR